MFHRMETHPNEAPIDTKVRLIDFCAVQSILTRSSLEALFDLALRSGWYSKNISFATFVNQAPRIREHTEENNLHPSAIAYVDQLSERREILELEFKQMGVLAL